MTLFGTLGGRVMGARAGLDLGTLGGGFGLPHEVLLDLAGATFRIFPWREGSGGDVPEHGIHRNRVRTPV